MLNCSPIYQYNCVCQGALFSSTVSHSPKEPSDSSSLIPLYAIQLPTISVYDPRFTTKYPSVGSDPDVSDTVKEVDFFFS